MTSCSGVSTSEDRSMTVTSILYWVRQHFAYDGHRHVLNRCATVTVMASQVSTTRKHINFFFSSWTLYMLKYSYGTGQVGDLMPG